MLNVKVTTSESAGAGGSAAFAGATFIVGEADGGPAGYVSVRSMAEYKNAFGPRSAGSAKLYDAVNTVLAIGKGRCYVARASDGTAATAKLVLKDAAGHPTLVVSAETPGIEGNETAIEVIEVGSEFQIVVFSEGEEIASSPEFTTQAQAIEWSKEAPLVTIAASTESEHTTAIPKALAKALLTGGVDASDLVDASILATLDVFPRSLGPGQVIIPGRTTAAIREGAATWAKENDRFAWCDLADQPTAEALIAGKAATPAAIAGCWGTVSSSAIIPGLAPSTTRTVAGSAVIAGMCALVARTGNNSTAPSGADWPIPYVIGFTNTYTEGEMEALQDAGINPFAEEGGFLILDGFYTALSRDVDPIFWQASASRERMALMAEGEEIAGRYRRKPLGGRKSSIGKFQGELQGMIKRHYEAGALFGDELAEAGTADVGDPINTPATIQAGELNAELRVKIVPFADDVNLNLVTAPVTETF